MKRVGVIGGGQLAWMMASAANKLGVELIVQTPSANDPAVAIAHDTVFASVADAAATAILASKCDVITFENEFVNLETLSVLAKQGVCFRPSLEALAPLLDKYHQRCYLRNLGLPVPKFFAVDQVGSQELGDGSNSIFEFLAFHNLDFPLVLKARRHGYDGQGTFIIKDIEDLQQKLAAATPENTLLPNSVFLLEEFIPFTTELAVIAARSVDGKVAIYPIVETQQQEQVCRRAIAPAEISPQLAAEIDEIARVILNGLEAVGVFGIELFLTADNKVLVNEIAPRTHNSGHFSVDACETSQFEQHLRAVCDLPLGNSNLICSCAIMVNLLGYEISTSNYIVKRQKIEQIPQTIVHWYGKTQSRPGRKLGHVNVLLNHKNRNEAMAIAHTIENIWYSN
ncbi:5-(carboxyamino)imidazole ribonucleotide synthase [Chlorogloeopsis sp. ULAP01]|uniref:5-(carboxyamino)imidazole ribonucleotide synthase n=1 Tax=Chlorogloeopsis sp. ULAP01 TaxID=3056483 RepID=UPI0025AA5913|nr:5-(carboxyamino)imidazole ribonucleotide synthase [Chlorogloeopsis sp. ULAP01]MDM9385621.1 5-(carboxyamino)imidazole ribonucleotide synthase [Chlorogloeopsis sp. ULAP01]